MNNKLAKNSSDSDDLSFVGVSTEDGKGKELKKNKWINKCAKNLRCLEDFVLKRKIVTMLNIYLY